MKWGSLSIQNLGKSGFQPNKLYCNLGKNNRRVSQHAHCHCLSFLIPGTSLRQSSKVNAPEIGGCSAKTETGRTWYYSETAERNFRGGWNAGLNLGPNRSALSILPDDDENYPAVTRALTFLRDRLVALALSSERMREASPPRAGGTQFLADGSNIPWIADVLLKENKARARSWIGTWNALWQGSSRSG